MNVRSYMDFYQLLKEERTNHAENRALALEKHLEGLSTIKRLSTWVQVHRDSLSRPVLSDAFCRYLYGVSLILGLLAFVTGFLSGATLLSYSGSAPVNVIYFLAMALFLPLLTMCVALLSMLRIGRVQQTLVHISPAYWMEKILGFLSGRAGVPLSEHKIPSLLQHWLVITRSQLLSLLFATGLLLALLGIVATQDIAFAWSTTLHIAPEEFYAFLHALAWPWDAWIPSAVPSMELIVQSQYFRLGGALGSEMVTHADLLGEWWRFLACATLFYAMLLRLLVWALSLYGFRRSLEKSFLGIEGAEKLLHQMATPVVSTRAVGTEVPLTQRNNGYRQMITSPLYSYERVLGWAMSDEEIVVLNDSMKIETQRRQSVGGVYALEKESRIIAESRGEVLLYVKSWEPPTMDIVDFVSDLAERVTRVTVLPVGTVADAYIPKEKELDMWGRKLSLMEHPKVWLWQSY